jgi:release factor glutamine methyltransferase
VSTWTVRRLLGWITEDLGARGIQTPRLDGELLVAHALGYDRIHLYMDLERPLGPAELERVRESVGRRRRREPIAYILGEREFYGRKFEVSPAVLIPRPDTETLIERALALMAKDRSARVLDLCSGSGAIAVTLAAERPQLRVDAADISHAALVIAYRNARRYDLLDRVFFFEGDLFDALTNLYRNREGTEDNITEPVPVNSTNVQAPYDVIVCNPPYIPHDLWKTLAPEIAQYEPAIALVAGEDGLSYYQRICQQIAPWLVPGATVLFEVGDNQAASVSDILKATGHFSAVQFYKDLRNIDRVVEAVFG